MCIKQHLDPSLRRVLLHLLEPFPASPPLPELSPTYSTLLTSQLRLGKRAIFMGFFLLKWHEIQNDFLKQNFLPFEQQQAADTLHKIAKALLLHTQKLWHTRNNDLHASNQTSESHKRTLLQQTITELYNKQHLLQHIDRQLFDKPLQDRLRESDNAMDEFINYVKPLIKHSMQQATLDDQNTLYKLNEYFQNLPPNIE